ncbi:MAG: hypothetical protein SVT56_11850 [Chloroflexota bacterium]|nr:hypothetical protein [Chloroflexota bacterium]
MAHKRLTINQRDLRRYLEDKFLPSLGPEWKLNRNDMILRCSDMITQGLYFDRSSYGKRFVPNFFVQVLPIPVDHFTMQLGSRLRDFRSAELWLDWMPEDDLLVKKILDAYRQQAKPRLDHPLTLEIASSYIEKFHRKSGHFHNLWSLGILYGLKNELKSARKQFEFAVKDLRQRGSEWEKKNKAPPEWVGENTKTILEFLSHLKTANGFRSYCEEKAARTASALKLC